MEFNNLNGPSSILSLAPSIKVLVYMNFPLRSAFAVNGRIVHALLRRHCFTRWVEPCLAVWTGGILVPLSINLVRLALILNFRILDLLHLLQGSSFRFCGGNDVLSGELA